MEGLLSEVGTPPPHNSDILPKPVDSNIHTHTHTHTYTHTHIHTPPKANFLYSVSGKMGGGWRNGNRGDVVLNIAHYIMQHGFTVEHTGNE